MGPPETELPIVNADFKPGRKPCPAPLPNEAVVNNRRQTFDPPRSALVMQLMKPEQSTPPGPAPPHTDGLPLSCRATRAPRARAALCADPVSATKPPRAYPGIRACGPPVACSASDCPAFRASRNG